MELTENERAILRVSQDTGQLGYKPSNYYDYPPNRLNDFAMETGLDIQIVADTVDSLIKKRVLMTQDGPPEMQTLGQPGKPFDFFTIWYAIAHTAEAQEACELGQI